MKKPLLICGTFVAVLLTAVCGWLFVQWSNAKEPIDPGMLTELNVSDGERPVGYVSGLVGSATAEDSEGVIRELALGDKVYLDESLETPGESRMQVTLLDGTMLNQGSHSEIKLVEYVFDPEVHANNVCTIEMERGVFRAITEKITRMNPEKFKVKTQNATIGIRGCEVGFRLSDEGDAVYMMEISKDRSVIVTAEDALSSVDSTK
jgi:hypothetical protein